MKITRRGFFQGTTLAATAGAASYFALNSANSTRKSIPGSLLGASAHIGHRLRAKGSFPVPEVSEKVNVAIIGSGVAGLSCGWKLKKHGSEDFKIFELEATAGGNARSGENPVTRYPWGAHYIPFLSEESAEARELFLDLGIITGYDNEGIPIYDDFAICVAPQERLFHFGKWQDGLLPTAGVSISDQKQAELFFEGMKIWSQKKGRDGKFAFSIPLARSSQDPEFLKLDRLSMAAFMTEEGWTSETLRWYVNYCCRDDFGTPFDQVSAWAGIHYFAARRGRASGVSGSGLVTWPEGNAWLTRKLSESMSKNLRLESLVYNVEQTKDAVFIDIWNTSSQEASRVQADHLVMACPRFIAPFVLSDNETHSKMKNELRADLLKMQYSPWMVANVALRSLPTGPVGAAIAWDNVFYEGRSLGYVVATNQKTQIFTGPTVLTYFLPLDESTPAEERKRAVATSLAQWQELVIKDLSRAHPEIAEKIERIDVWLWGHAMIRPQPGFMWGQERHNLQKSHGRIHFANSDMSGISIFEEANFHGVQAANKILQGLVSDA